MSETPTVVIVDDHRIFRSGVRAELGEAVEVLGDAESVEDAVRTITELEPDVVLLDLGLPDLEGLQVLKRLREWSEVPVIVLTVRDDVQEKVAALDAGAYGVSISGAGPSAFAVASEDSIAHSVATAMRDAYVTAGLECATRVTRVDSEGAIVHDGDSSRPGKVSSRVEQ